MLKTYSLHFNTWIKIMVELLMGFSMVFCILHMYIKDTCLLHHAKKKQMFIKLASINHSTQTEVYKKYVVLYFL